MTPPPARARHPAALAPLSISVGLAACTPAGAHTDLLLAGGNVIDGTGTETVVADVAVTGDRIVFVGDAAASRITAADTVDVSGLAVAPGFIDMHSHAELDAPHGRDARAFLHQGITTVSLGLDGGGSAEVQARMIG